jgi:cell division transport system permease protein
MRRRVARALSEAAVSLSRGWRSTLLAMAAIVSAVFVLGAFLLVSRAVDRAVGQWSEAAEMSVFLRDDIGAADRRAVEQTLREHAAVRDVVPITGEDATRRFAESFPDLAPLAGPGGDVQLPASLDARLHRDADVGAVMALADRVRALPGVADVRVDQQLLAGLLNVARLGRLVGGGLSAILILAAALSIASVVRLSYVARRDEVDVLFLLGAPLSAIRAPFVAEGAIQGALGTAGALALLAIAHELITRRYGEALANLPVSFLPAWLVAALLGGGMLVGAAPALAAVRGQRPDALE